MKILLIIISFSTCLFSFGQQKTSYKKVFLDIDGSYSLPVIYAALSSNRYGFTKLPKGLSKRYNLIDAGARASLNFVLDENTSMGLEIGTRQFTSRSTKNDFLTRNFTNNSLIQYEELNARVQDLQFSETYFGFRSCTNLALGVLPIGFSLENGMSYGIIQLKQTEYIAESNLPRNTSSEILLANVEDALLNNRLISPKITEFKRLNIFYGLRMNYPITRAIFVHLGFRYNVSFRLAKMKKMREYDNSDYWISSYDVFKALNNRSGKSLLSANLGFTFSF